MNQQQPLNEGLRPLDLQEMIYPTFEVDTFKSKMGEDRDVCVVSFQVKDRAPAKDLMEFIEKGYNFVLDADVSAGENNKGEYSVFVEISRSPLLSEQIKEIISGVERLTGIKEFKFRYHKELSLHEAADTELKSVIPSTAKDYEMKMISVQTESLKQFFNKTLMDDLVLENDIITIYKHFDKQVQLKLIKEGNSESILEGIEDGFSVDEAATSEVFWLTKVLGDYSINKIGENFVFNNGNRSILLKRI